MKPMRMLMMPLAGLTLLPSYAAELTFELQSHPSAVALQFDVSAIGAQVIRLTSPELLLESAHVVDHNVVSSGATRYVMYSTSVAPITPEGKLRVTLESEGPLTSRMIEVTNVIASDGNGQQVSSTPNARPVLIDPAFTNFSGRVGEPTVLLASVVDLDGSIASIDFRLSESSRGIVSSAPFQLSWMPDAEGEFPLSIETTDDKGAVASFSIGTVLVGPPLVIEDDGFEAFGKQIYGEEADPSWYAVGADPLESGIPNGIAYLLDIDPHQPDFSRLPQTSLETQEDESYFTLRFSRLTDFEGVQWMARQSSTMRTIWNAVPSDQITEQETEGGFTDVIIRVPIGDADPAKLFLQLQVTP